MSLLLVVIVILLVLAFAGGIFVSPILWVVLVAVAVIAAVLAYSRH